MKNGKKYKISEEVLAVISAAVFSISGKHYSDIVVRPIIRAPQTMPVWNYAGRIERISRNLNS
jgi:hypothetical protein